MRQAELWGGRTPGGSSAVKNRSASVTVNQNVTTHNVLDTVLAVETSVKQWTFSFSPEKAEFMKDCESSYSSWKFSGGFRTWVKMSLVKTKEEDGSETVEFKQEVKKKNTEEECSGSS